MIDIKRALRVGSRINNSTDGSVLFVDSSLKIAEDNSNFFWDDTNKRLGIGTDVPEVQLHVLSSGTAGIPLTTTQSVIFQRSGTASTNNLVSIVSGNNAAAALSFGDTDQIDVGQLAYSHSSNLFSIRVAGNTRFGIRTGGKTHIGATADDTAQLKITNGINTNSVLRLKAHSTQSGNILEINTNAGSGGDLVVVDSSGDVGIGTVAPASELHVKDASSSAELSIDSAAGSEIKLAFREAGTIEGLIDYRADTTPERFDFFAGGNASGDRKMVIEDTGNVGIGTDSPATTQTYGQALSISRPGSGVGNEQSVGNLNFITQDGSFTGIFADGIAAEISAISETSSGGAHGLSFLTSDISGDRAERVRIDKDGNVGIGTTTPTQKLQVLGNVEVTGVSPRLRINGGVGSAGIPGLEFYENSVRKWLYFNNNIDDSFNIKTNTLTIMTLTQGGDVGIGTTTPDTTLEVNGAITINELSSDPTDPVEGKAVFWKSDGTATGDDGDLLYKEQSGSTVTQGSLKWKDFIPSSVTLNTGTSSSVVADAQVMFDGNTYDIAEVTGVPGFDVEFNFTNVDRVPTIVVARWRYDGSATHFVTIDIWNYNTSAWDQLRMFKDSSAYFDSMTMYIPRASNGDYVDGSGNSKVRFYHQTSGNASHDIHIDYVGLTHSLQGVI